MTRITRWFRVFRFALSAVRKTAWSRKRKESGERGGGRLIRAANPRTPSRTFLICRSRRCGRYLRSYFTREIAMVKRTLPFIYLFFFIVMKHRLWNLSRLSRVLYDKKCSALSSAYILESRADREFICRRNRISARKGVDV